MRVLGVDPGSRATGWGVVERLGSRVSHVAHGTIRTAAGPLELRLAQIVRQLGEAIDAHRPELAVVERVFVASNPRSALVLGQARGAALAAIGAAGLPVDELAAKEVKKAVTGVGSADKAQVQAMVARLLSLPSPPPQDAADALAAALCRAQMGRLAGLTRRTSRRHRRPRIAPRGARI